MGRPAATKLLGESHVQKERNPFRQTISRRLFTGGIAAGAALAATGLPTRRARAAAPLKIGVLLPRSGHLALIGQQCQRGADIAVPLLADMGHSVTLMNADIESSPDVARTQAES